ncbi:MAG: cupin domain-containing protein [Anaerolineae bacterium]|nr:cupin domain-containing protein [Anaerolineae bacterium]
MDAYAYIAHLPTELPDIPPDSIISRTVYTDDQVKVVLFGFAPNTELSEHMASQPAMLVFIEGEAALTLGGDTQEARAGTWVHMPPHLSHSVAARTPVVMLLVLLRSEHP